LFFKFCAIVIGLLKVTYLLTYVIFSVSDTKHRRTSCNEIIIPSVTLPLRLKIIAMCILYGIGYVNRSYLSSLHLC